MFVSCFPLIVDGMHSLVWVSEDGVIQKISLLTSGVVHFKNISHKIAGHDNRGNIEVFDSCTPSPPQIANQLPSKAICINHLTCIEGVGMATPLTDCLLCPILYALMHFTIILCRKLSNNSFTGSFPAGLCNSASLRFL